MTLAITHVDAFALFPDEHNVRRTLKVPDELVQSIKQMGIIEPLVVRKVGEKLCVVAGARRMIAAQQIGIKQVPIMLRTLTDLEALGLSLQENLQRKDLSSIETADAIADLWGLLGEKKSEAKYTEIEHKFGIAKEQTLKYLAVSRLAEEVKECIAHHGGQQDVTVLSEISRESSWSDVEKAEVIEVLSEVPTATERREVVKELRELADSGLSPREAFEQIMTEKKEAATNTDDGVGQWKYEFRIKRSVENRFMDKCKRLNKKPQDVVIGLVERWANE